MSFQQGYNFIEIARIHSTINVSLYFLQSSFKAGLRQSRDIYCQLEPMAVSPRPHALKEHDRRHEPSSITRDMSEALRYGSFEWLDEY